MPAASHSSVRAIPLTLAALVAFAANSVLCRIALRDAAIDPVSFTTIRFVSGALMLVAVASRGERSSAVVPGSWAAAAILALYAVPFAVAYTQLSAGTGALILFGCVQMTMIAAALVAGDRPRPVQWGGMTIALAGLVYLVLPGLTAPPPGAAFLMALAGVCWGLYSLRGRSTTDPLAQNAKNFVRAVPLVGMVTVLTLGRAHASTAGVAYAVTSGAITSGLGYVVWYAALRRLSAVQAAVVQLMVPLLAAAGGVVFLAESITLRLVIATVLVLGGIAAAIVGSRRAPA